MVAAAIKASAISDLSRRIGLLDVQFVGLLEDLQTTLNVKECWRLENPLQYLHDRTELTRTLGQVVGRGLKR